MPTYRSTASEVKHFDGFSIRPGESKTISQYLNLRDYPFLIKVSDSPDIAKSFKIILENISTISNMSEILTVLGRSILKVVDNSPGCSDGDQVILTLFIGETDNQAEFIPVSLHKFVRISQKDFNGIENHYWISKYCTDETSGFTFERNIFNAFQSGGIQSFFTSVAVTSLNLSGGSIDVLLKTWG